MSNLMFIRIKRRAATVVVKSLTESGVVEGMWNF